MVETNRITPQVVIDALCEGLNPKPGSRILEPSAGHGVLADGVKEKFQQCNIDCVELNQSCRTTLKRKGYNLVGADFFRFEAETLYDHIIACPNFRDNIDCKHIMHMYDQLAVGGTISSLTSPFWMTGET
ncbi:MAG: hypothetical protein P8J32_05885 [bacterium]|nr:hypothetical protein [bacterium]